MPSDDTTTETEVQRDDQQRDVDKFEIRVDDETVISRDSMVTHIEYGPMHVDRVAYSPQSKRIELKSELGPEGLTLTADELRERWGETLHTDPMALHERGSARVVTEGLSAPDSDVEVDLRVNGPQDEVDDVQLHAKDQIVRAMQAHVTEQPPADCKGIGVSIDWERKFADSGEEKNDGDE